MTDQITLKEALKKALKLVTFTKDKEDREWQVERDEAIERIKQRSRDGVLGHRVEGCLSGTVKDSFSS